MRKVFELVYIGRFSYGDIMKMSHLEFEHYHDLLVKQRKAEDAELQKSYKKQ